MSYDLISGSLRDARVCKRCGKPVSRLGFWDESPDGTRKWIDDPQMCEWEYQGNKKRRLTVNDPHTKVYVATEKSEDKAGRVKVSHREIVHRLYEYECSNEECPAYGGITESMTLKVDDMRFGEMVVAAEPEPITRNQLFAEVRKLARKWSS